jgi:hypothetical protein
MRELVLAQKRVKREKEKKKRRKNIITEVKMRKGK